MIYLILQGGTELAGPPRVTFPKDGAPDICGISTVAAKKTSAENVNRGKEPATSSWTNRSNTTSIRSREGAEGDRG